MIYKTCLKCNFKIHAGVYVKHTKACDGRGPRRKRPSCNGTCPHCNKSGFSPLALGGHITSCSLNPKHAERKRKSSESLRGRKLSEETKKKLSDTTKRKVAEGTWHLSFSKSRTHEYKGIRLHGMWEVKYAMYLDNLNIKWRRPTEKFKYIFKEKSSYYTPDFYLEDEKVYIEIKGYKTPRDEAKWSQFPDELKVLEGKDLVQLGILDVYSVRNIKN